MDTALKKSPPFSKPLLVSALSQNFRSPKLTNSDESLYSFIQRRFGREVAAYVIDPLARGVFAGNAKELSIRSLGKSLHDYEQTYGGVFKGVFRELLKFKSKDPLLKDALVKKSRQEKWAVWSLEGGIEELVHTLAKSIEEKGVEIKLEHPVTQMVQDCNKIRIECGTEILSSDHVICCLPSNRAAFVCSGLNADLKPLLSSIPFATVAVVNLEYEGENVVSQPAFGYLVPSSESCKALGVIFDTCTFPQPNKTILTVMLGGYWFESLFGKNPEKQTIRDAAIEEVTRSLNIKQDPCKTRVSILRDCIPQYVVGHSEAVSNARRLIKQQKLPLYLAGNSYDGVGVNDAIMSAKNAVLQLKL